MTALTEIMLADTIESPNRHEKSLESNGPPEIVTRLPPCTGPTQGVTLKTDTALKANRTGPVIDSVPSVVTETDKFPGFKFGKGHCNSEAPIHVAFDKLPPTRH